MEWNKVIYTDCMNENNGLPSLPDKSIDLCLTDFPYNINAKKVININAKGIRIVELYNDIKKNYEEWCKKIFNELKRICNQIIFTSGRMNLRMWYFIDNFELIAWTYTNGSSTGRISQFIHFDPILCYGNFKKKKLKFDHLPIQLKIGITRGIKYIHPHPKPIMLYKRIIHELNPKSVIDPFMGSGTTAEVCIKLGIPYIGYEINSIYKHDMDLRISKGMSCIKSPRHISYWLK